MPHTDPEKRKAYHAKYMKEVWYPKNKEKHLSFVRKNKDRVSEFIEEYKKERSCVDCGFQGREFPYVLDFDHKNIDTVKKFNIGSWRHSVLSIETVMQEIEKCELVCANCHRKRTFRQK